MRNVNVVAEKRINRHTCEFHSIMTDQFISDTSPTFSSQIRNQEFDY